MKVLKVILFVIAGIIVTLLVAALFIPKTYHVERSVLIQAPQPLVMEQASSLQKMDEWNPFIEMDPAMKITYEGSGEGSTSSWVGDDAGEGSQTITKITENSVETRLDFRKPMEGTALAFFRTEPAGSDVKVIWSMEGSDTYPFNIMVPFMDNMIGKEYEKGLQKLKSKTEELAKQ